MIYQSALEGLEEFLPNEALLERFFSFRAKFITDIENKCKYGLRNANDCDSSRWVCPA